MRRLMVVVGLAGALVPVVAAGASSNAANVRIDFRHSDCLHVPDLKQIRFLVQLVNTGGSVGSFGPDIRFSWRPVNGGWKNSPNRLKGGQLRVPARSGTLYYSDLAADAAKKILACGLRIGSSPTIHRIGVLVRAPV